jgi:predicted kinase
MKLFEIAGQREIILVCGNLCSGKGHFCASKYPDYHRIGVSDVVRSLSKAQDRSELSKTAHLDTQIVEALSEEIRKHDKVIVDGIRQPTIMYALRNRFANEIKDIIWLDVPEDTLRQRYETRASAKDKAMTFDQAIQSDKNLGIGDVENYIRANHKVLPYS